MCDTSTASMAACSTFSSMIVYNKASIPLRDRASKSKKESTIDTTFDTTNNDVDHPMDKDLS